MRRPWQASEHCFALGSGNGGFGDDSLSAADSCIHRRQVLRVGKMKRKQAVILALVAVLVLLAAAYLWAVVGSGRTGTACRAF